jgi:hypothetical protein
VFACSFFARLRHPRISKRAAINASTATPPTTPPTIPLIGTDSAPLEAADVAVGEAGVDEPPGVLEFEVDEPPGVLELELIIARHERHCSLKTYDGTHTGRYLKKSTLALVPALPT